jgi:hypothetical protein
MYFHFIINQSRRAATGTTETRTQLYAKVCDPAQKETGLGMLNDKDKEINLNNYIQLNFYGPAPSNLQIKMILQRIW